MDNFDHDNTKIANYFDDKSHLHVGKKSFKYRMLRGLKRRKALIVAFFISVIGLLGAVGALIANELNQFDITDDKDIPDYKPVDTSNFVDGVEVANKINDNDIIKDTDTATQELLQPSGPMKQYVYVGNASNREVMLINNDQRIESFYGNYYLLKDNQVLRGAMTANNELVVVTVNKNPDNTIPQHQFLFAQDYINQSKLIVENGQLIHEQTNIVTQKVSRQVVDGVTEYKTAPVPETQFVSVIDFSTDVSHYVKLEVNNQIRFYYLGQDADQYEFEVHNNKYFLVKKTESIYLYKDHAFVIKDDKMQEFLKSFNAKVINDTTLTVPDELVSNGKIVSRGGSISNGKLVNLDSTKWDIITHKGNLYRVHEGGTIWQKDSNSFFILSSTEVNRIIQDSGSQWLTLADLRGEGISTIKGVTNYTVVSNVDHASNTYKYISIDNSSNYLRVSNSQIAGIDPLSYKALWIENIDNQGTGGYVLVANNREIIYADGRHYMVDTHTMNSIITDNDTNMLLLDAKNIRTFTNTPTDITYARLPGSTDKYIKLFDGMNRDAYQIIEHEGEYYVIANEHKKLLHNGKLFIVNKTFNEPSNITAITNESNKNTVFLRDAIYRIDNSKVSDLKDSDITSNIISKNQSIDYESYYTNESLGKFDRLVDVEGQIVITKTFNNVIKLDGKLFAIDNHNYDIMFNTNKGVLLSLLTVEADHIAPDGKYVFGFNGKHYLIDKGYKIVSIGGQNLLLSEQELNRFWNNSVTNNSNISAKLDSSQGNFYSEQNATNTRLTVKDLSGKAVGYFEQVGNQYNIDKYNFVRVNNEVYAVHKQYLMHQDVSGELKLYSENEYNQVVTSSTVNYIKLLDTAKNNIIDDSQFVYSDSAFVGHTKVTSGNKSGMYYTGILSPEQKIVYQDNNYYIIPKDKSLHSINFLGEKYLFTVNADISLPPNDICTTVESIFTDGKKVFSIPNSILMQGKDGNYIILKQGQKFYYLITTAGKALAFDIKYIDFSHVSYKITDANGDLKFTQFVHRSNIDNNDTLKTAMRVVSPLIMLAGIIGAGSSLSKGYKLGLQQERYHSSSLDNDLEQPRQVFPKQEQVLLADNPDLHSPSASITR